MELIITSLKAEERGSWRERIARDGYLEWANVHGSNYGTPSKISSRE
ncbi:MAG: hypothetical protein R2883_05995 [Caldisericia bacterium]